jgi:LuxR family transcriptional regulator/LuxR family quorum-sensing system transcriptional regulator CciR
MRSSNAADKVNSFLANSQSANSTDNLISCFEEAIFETGVKYYAYHHLMVGFRRTDLADSLRCAQLPDGWLAHYTKMDYFSIDPIQKAAATRTSPFPWADIHGKDALSARQRQFLDDLVGAGFGAGVSVPVFSRPGALTYFCFGTGSRDLLLSPAEIFALQVICIIMDLQYERLSPRKAEIPLSHREAQMAGLLTEGRTNREIASQMGVTVHTVDTLVRRCFSKLKVNCRIGLAFAAAARGLALTCPPCPNDESLSCACAPGSGPCACDWSSPR